nr:hypothetical protein [Tanacetum cinerariifolium]
MKALNKKNADLLAQIEVLQDQLKVKHVVIDTHTECQPQYARLEEERCEYMIRYSALCDNNKQHRKKIDEQEILFDKMSRQLVELNNNVLKLQEKILEKETKISELKGCQNQGDVNEALGYKKKAVVVTSDPLALVAEKIKVSKRKEKVEVQSESEENCKKAKVKDYNYYKTKTLLAKKDSDEQVLLAEDQAWMESSSDSDQETNANMVFMAKMEKVLSDLDKNSSSAEETIAEVAYLSLEVNLNMKIQNIMINLLIMVYL